MDNETRVGGNEGSPDGEAELELETGSTSPSRPTKRSYTS